MKPNNHVKTTARQRMAQVASGFVLLATAVFLPAQAANFAPTNPAELIAAINTANTNGADDVIDLGGNTTMLTAVNNTSNGANGLPVIQPDGGNTTIVGASTRQISAGFAITADNSLISSSSAPACVFGTSSPRFGALSVTGSNNFNTDASCVGPGMCA